MGFAQGIDAYFYSSPFYAPKYGEYIETYIAIAGKSVNYILNQEYLDKLKDPEVRKAMIESFKATKHWTQKQ